MKNFIAAGDSITVLVDDIAMGTPITAGTGQILGEIFGVAANSTGPVDIDDGSSVVLNLTGIYDLPKAPSQAWAPGAKVYWDNTAKACTTVSANNTLIGIAAERVGATAAETTGRVRLNGVAL